MAMASTISAKLLSYQLLCSFSSAQMRKNSSSSFMHVRKKKSFTVRAVKAPAGVIIPKDEPKLVEPFFGFTKTAEIWNSRACMIGLIGTLVVELILHKGILQTIGVDVGKGLDIPL